MKLIYTFAFSAPQTILVYGSATVPKYGLPASKRKWSGPLKICLQNAHGGMNTIPGGWALYRGRQKNYMGGRTLYRGDRQKYREISTIQWGFILYRVGHNIM